MRKKKRTTIELQKMAATMSQRKLIYLKFKQHKLAVVSFYVLMVFYIMAIFAGFFAVNDPNTRFANMSNAPPSRVYLFDENGLTFPYLFPVDRELDQQTFEFIYIEDRDNPARLRFFVRGFSYNILGIFSADVQFVGADAPFLPMGADALGRCMYSRIVYGSQVSLSIGLVGVAISFIIGVIIGGISGYFGGKIDEIIQRVIDFIISIPQIPLWMVMSAVIPNDWGIIETYFAITIILSLVGWCALARVVRGKLLSLREEDFIAAAKVSGAGEARIIMRHLLPSFSSQLIVSITLSVPRMILSETALSFVGVGMQPPAISWGVLLQDAQNLLAIANFPWQLLPAVAIIIVVLMFNFFGDGLRDAVDPYGVKQD